MWANCAFSFAVAFFCMTAYLPAAEVRTWTDSNGQTMEGELLEVTADDKAVIRSNGKTFTIPMARFSATDRQYIKAHQEGNSKESENGRDAEDEPKRQRKPRRSDLFDTREWTNSEGLTIRARYVRINEGLIVLMQGKKGVQAPFDKLSVEDQEFLRTHLEARGEADLLPDIQPQAPEGLASGDTSAPSFPGAGMSPQPGNNSAPPPSFPAPSGPAYFPPPETPAYDPAVETSPQEAKPEPSEPESPRYEPEQLAAHTLSGPPSGPHFPPPETRRHVEEMQERNRQRHEELTKPQMSYVCSNCNKDLPEHIGAGDYCPHCRVYLEYEEDEYGQQKKHAPAPWRRRSWIGVAIAVLVGVIRFGMKAMKS